MTAYIAWVRQITKASVICVCLQSVRQVEIAKKTIPFSMNSCIRAWAFERPKGTVHISENIFMRTVSINLAYIKETYPQLTDVEIW